MLLSVFCGLPACTPPPKRAAIPTPVWFEPTPEPVIEFIQPDWQTLDHADFPVYDRLETPPRLPDPAGIDPKYNWKLIYTSSSSFDYRSPLGRRADGTAPGLEKIFQTIFDGGGGGDGRAMASSSPIQRSVLSAPGIEATQDIFDLLSGKGGRVDQCVKAGPAFLKLSASATFDTSLGRVDFLFDEAYLLLGGAIRVPYPVPFRLLGDEARGYLDTSYVSKRLRVSRGNKGTTFVLVRGA